MTWEWVVLILGVVWVAPASQWVSYKVEVARERNKELQEWKSRTIV